MILNIAVSNYVLGNLKIEQFPEIAIMALEEGCDTPSLRVLAGLGNDPWEIDEYLSKALAELGIKYPNPKEAGLILIEYYIKQIVEGRVGPIQGVEKIIHEVIRKVRDFTGKDKKYACDYISFQKLYGLYYSYDDAVNPLVAISSKKAEKLVEEIKEDIIQAAKEYIESLEDIKKKVLRDE